MNTDVCKILGEAIANQRNEAGTTQEALAGQVGLSPRSIQRIEAGMEQPRYETLFKIAYVLETDPQSLMRPMWSRWLEDTETER